MHGSRVLHNYIRICLVIAILVFTLILLVVARGSHVGALGLNCLSVASGNWNDPGIWSSCGDGVPGSGDSATIVHAIELGSDVDLTTGSISINTGGTLDTSASSFDITATRLSINTGGVFTANGSVVTLSGVNTVFTRTGVFNHGESTVRYTGSATVSIAAGTYYNLQVDHPNGTFNAANSAVGITIENLLLVSSGNFRGSTRTITLTGSLDRPFVLNGNFTPGTSTIVYAGENPHGSVEITPTTYHNLQTNNPQAVFEPTDDMTVAGRLTVSSGAFRARDTTITLSGTGTAFSKAGAGIFDQGNSTVRYTGGTQNTSIAAVDYYNLDLDHAGTTFTLANNITVSNTLTISAGNLNASTRRIAFTGNSTEPFINNDTFTQSTSTISYEGSSLDGDIIVPSVPYYNVAFDNADGVYVASGDLTVSGNWTNVSGSFNANGHAVTFDGVKTSGNANQQYDIFKSITSNGSSFDDIIFNNDLGVWQPLDDLTVDGNLTVVAGDLIGNKNVTVRGGDVTGNGTINFVNGTFSLYGTGDFGGEVEWRFHNLHFGNGVDASITSKTSTNSITATGILNIKPSHTLSAGNDTWILTGSGVPFVVDGHFVKEQSTFRFAPYQTASVTATDYYNLEIVRSIVDMDEVWIPAHHNIKRFTNDGMIDGVYPIGVQPRGIAIDAEGNIWVASRWNNVIQKLSRSGVIINQAKIGNTQYGLFGVVIDSLGSVWTVDFEEHNVKKIDGTTFEVMGTFPISSGSWGGIAVDKSDNVWVANSRDNNVVKMGNDGQVLGTYAVGDEPHSVGLDEEGNVWVANYASHDVTKLNSHTGQTIGSYPTGLRPHAVFGDASGNMWVVNTGSNDVTKLRAVNGEVVGTYPVGREPIGGSVDADGNIWVESADDDSIAKLNGLTGEVIGVYSLDIPASLWSYTFGDFTGFTLQHFVCGGSCGAGKDVTISPGVLNIANNFTIGDGISPLTVSVNTDNTDVRVVGDFNVMTTAEYVEVSRPEGVDTEQGAATTSSNDSGYHALGKPIVSGRGGYEALHQIVTDDDGNDMSELPTTRNVSDLTDNRDAGRLDKFTNTDDNQSNAPLFILIVGAVFTAIAFWLVMKRLRNKST